MYKRQVLYIAGFVLAVIAASMNVSAWGIDLSAKTIMIILIEMCIRDRSRGYRWEVLVQLCFDPQNEQQVKN